MSSPLPDYLCRQVSGLLHQHRVVVFYDPRGEFTPFIDELEAGATEGTVQLEDVTTTVVRYEGSFFAVRAKAELLFAANLPEPLLIYIPGVERDRKGSVLMELELAGKIYEPQLKRIARHVLTKRYTDGVIDEMRLSAIPVGWGLQVVV